MAKKTQLEKLAIHGGEPVKKTPFATGKKHNLDEWRAIKPIFERGEINMTRGPEVMELREKFKKLFGMKYAVTASSGTAVLHAATAALGVGHGDEVITSPVTDMGTIIAILQQNAVPIFADVDPLTNEITPETIESKITSRTKSVIVVHWGGLAADMRGIMRVARRHKITVVEDMAQSYLCKQGKRYSGTFGHIGCWSLNESKHIGAGDGGVLLTNSRKLARYADLFADKCYDRETHKSDPFFAPYNYRLNTLVAGVCLEQMKKVRRICAKRHSYGTRLDRALNKIEGITPRPVRKGDYATYWYYEFFVEPEILKCTSDEFAEAVRAEGVGVTAFHRSVMNWTIFRQYVNNRKAFRKDFPLYKGRLPDYDSSHYPGLMQSNARCIRMFFREWFAPQDITDTIHAIKKVAAHFREANR